MSETQDLGTARVNIVADTSDAVAGIEAVKRSVAGMAEDGKRNMRDLATAERERTTGLGQYITAIRTGNVRQLAMNEAMRFGRIAIAGIGVSATAAVAGVAALGFAWGAHNARLNEANNALIVSGNYARTTADEMQGIAAEMDRMRGVTTGTAMAALSEVAATGRFTVEEMEMVARAAEQWRVATGTAVDDTVEIFKKIADDPIKALLKLHETQNFLTKEQLAYLDTLKAQGREQELVTEGIRIYANRIEETAPQIAANVGNIAKAWRWVKETSGEAVDEVVNATGRMMDMLAAGSPGPFGSLARAIDARRAVPAQPGANVLPTTAGKEREEAEKALREFESLALSNLSKRERLEADIAKIRERGLAAGQKQAAIDKAVADARARFAEAEARSNRSRTRTRVDPADTLINRLRQQIALNQEQLEQEDNLTTSQRLRVQVEQELERIGGKMVASKRSLIDALVAELTTTGDLVKAHQQELKNKEALARQEAILAAQAENRRAANQADLLSIGHGAEQVERVRRLIDIQREYTEELKRLGDRSVADDQAAWDLMAENARRHRDVQLQEETEFQRKRAELMADWRQGRDRAIADYVSAANDIGGQAYEMLNSGLGELEARIVGVATTGKFEWRSMLDAWTADLTRFATRQIFADMLKKFFPGAGEQDQAAALGQAAGKLAASATPLLAAAAALSGSAAALAAAGASGGGGGASGGGNNGWLALLNIAAQGFKDGAAFSNGLTTFGSQGASNQVVSRPTLFAFARGMGLMGEAGPEAIMPLRRLPSGRLGVEQAMPATRQRDVVVHQVIQVQGKVTSETANQMATATWREGQAATRRFG